MKDGRYRVNSDERGEGEGKGRGDVIEDESNFVIHDRDYGGKKYRKQEDPLIPLDEIPNVGEKDIREDPGNDKGNVHKEAGRYFGHEHRHILNRVDHYSEGLRRK